MSEAMIHLILGPMYAEKTTNLLRHFRRFSIAKNRCLLVKYRGDTRYTDQNYIATHDRIVNTTEAIPCESLSEINQIIDKYDVIFIDEIQFYPDAIKCCQAWRQIGKIVIACGLYTNFQRKPFDQMPELIAIADHVEFLTAICDNCHHDNATTSHRISDEKTERVIGGTDKYIPLCQLCYEALKTSD